MAFSANSYEKEDRESEIQNSVRRINTGHRPCTDGFRAKLNEPAMPSVGRFLK